MNILKKLLGNGHPVTTPHVPTQDVVDKPDWIKEIERNVESGFGYQIGLFFFYQGRPIRSTRKFCQERHGRAWHRDEIILWGKDANKGNGWKGMHKGTNAVTIFHFRGGYNCRHVWVPVDIMSVPPDDLARMRAKGLRLE